MRSSARLLALAIMLSMLVIPGTAHAAPDRTITVAAGQTATFSGANAGVNFCYFGLPGVGVTSCPGLPQATCTKNVQQYCDLVLIRFDNPVPESHPTGTVKRNMTIALTTDTLSDYDLLAYGSNVAGDKKAEIGRSTASPPPLGSSSRETITQPITTTTTAGSSYVLLEIVHWAPMAGYTINVSF